VHPVYKARRPSGGGGAPVHRGSGGDTGGTTLRRSARERFRPRLLAVRIPRGRGSRGEPHRGVSGRRGGAVW
jgi:hypothetical protein